MKKQVTYKRKNNIVYKEEKTLLGTSTKKYGEYKNGKFKRTYTPLEELERGVDKTTDLFQTIGGAIKSKNVNIADKFFITAENVVVGCNTHEEKMAILKKAIKKRKNFIILFSISDILLIIMLLYILILF